MNLKKMYNKGKHNKIDTRGIIDHGFIESIYFRDPNGYVIELTCPVKGYKEQNYSKAKNILDNWQINKKKKLKF